MITQAKQPELDREKLKRLIHYICASVEHPSELGKTKLHKILYFSDFLFFLNKSNSITGETYIKKKFGPVSSHLNDILEELKQEDIIEEKRANIFNYFRTEFHCLEDPDTSIFSKEEILQVDQVLGSIANDHTASSISDLSHDEFWSLAEINQPIPYETIVTKPTREPSKEAIDWAEEQIENKFYA